MERRVIELPEGGSAMRPTNDLEEPAPDRETPPWRVSRWRSSRRQGDEGVRSSIGTIGDIAEVRHHDQAQNHRAAGRLSPAVRLISFLDLVTTHLSTLPLGVLRLAVSAFSSFLNNAHMPSSV